MDSFSFPPSITPSLARALFTTLLITIPSRLYQFAIVRDISPRYLLFQPSLRLTGTRYLKSPRPERKSVFKRRGNFSPNDLTILPPPVPSFGSVGYTSACNLESNKRIPPSILSTNLCTRFLFLYKSVSTDRPGRGFESRLFRVVRATTREGERPVARSKGHG